jgi:PAS domain S-box-containing protein
MGGGEPRIDHRQDERVRQNLGPLVSDEPGLSDLRTSDEPGFTGERELALGLSESHTHFRQVFDHAPIGIGLRSLDGRLIQSNEAMCRITGYDADQLRGMATLGITHPDDRELDAQLARELLAGERDSYEIEKRYVRADGRVAWVEVHCSLLRDADGEPQSVVGHVVDVDERRRAQEELRVSESRFRRAFDGALVGMVLTEPGGRVRRVNPTFCEMLGRTEEELLGIDFRDFTHPDDRATDAAHVAAMRSGERDGDRWDKRYIDSGGRTVWVELSTSLIRDDEGEPLYHVTQVHDISARKRADQLKEEFIATVSHELRSPLTSIQGYVELLAEEERSPRDQQWLEVIARNSHRLQRLVDDLLFIAQARAETLTLKRAEVDLEALLREAVEGTAPRAAEQGLDLHLDVAPVTIAHADADRLGQAVDNLISNALKYTPRAGRIDVRLERRGDEAAITVADTGIGMSEEDRQRLFERFFRASSAVDAAIPGVGLGLSIVRAIVDLHDGEIRVESAEGRGTSFEIVLPVGQRPPAAVSARKQSAVA